jgi:predicted dehydrogenase
VVANIGIGGMGRNHVGPDTAALCDVDEGRMADVLNTVMKSGKRTMPNPPDLYTDFRRILDRKDIDAVTSGTPDHWHAHIAVMACQAGKHVYSEKPTARTIEEGRAMVNAARHYKRVVQIGAQGRSNVNARAACQYVRNGMLGKVSRVEILHPDNPSTERWLDPQPVPKGLDWNMWCGPVRWRPFNSLYHPANFRWFLELGGGQIRDRGNHAISIACWLMNHDDYRGRVVVEAKGTPQIVGGYDTPRNLELTWKFDEWTLVWKQLADIPKSHAPWGATYIGDKDSLIVTQGDNACNTEDKAKQYVPPSGGEVFLQPSPPDMPATDRHRLNWMECIKTGARPATDVELGYRSVTYCILGNMAWTLGRKLTYDVGAEHFVNDAEADRLMKDSYRSPWTL